MSYDDFCKWLSLISRFPVMSLLIHYVVTLGLRTSIHLMNRISNAIPTLYSYTFSRIGTWSWYPFPPHPSYISRESSTSLVCIEAGAPKHQIVKIAGLGGGFHQHSGPSITRCTRGRGNAYSHEMIPPVVASRILLRVSVVHSSC